jgi:hypothetical protein
LYLLEASDFVQHFAHGVLSVLVAMQQIGELSMRVLHSSYYTRARYFTTM